jgi:lipoyl-dependent peroxiredoxin
LVLIKEANMKILYKTKAVSTGGRDGGKVKVENSPLEFDMTIPSEMGGPGKPGANPEQLFAAGYSACFESALRGAARRKKLDLKSVSVAVEIGIGRDDKGGYSLLANIVGTVSGVDQATADMLIQEAHQGCPYSRATRGNIEVTVSARVA